MDFLSFVMIAFIVESLWETLKMVRNGSFNWNVVGVMIIGVVIAVGAGIDLFTFIDIPLRVPYLGMVLTGLLISRGSNFVHDMFEKLNDRNIE